MKPQEQFKSRMLPQLRGIFIFTILYLVGMGVYSLYTGSSTGGTLVGRFGGSKTVSYGAYGFFEIAGILLLGALIFSLPSNRTKQPVYSKKRTSKQMALLIDQFYLTKDEPNRGCLLALRDIILAQDPDVTAEWKYSMPFFCYKGKMFCYLSIHKKTQHPFLCMVEGKHLHHPELIYEDRARMKIMIIDPEADLPVDTIRFILNEALDLYRSGLIKVPKRK